MHQDSKDAMVRVGTLDGVVVADFAKRLKGRGGYLHPRRECLERFVNSKVKVFRSLRRKIDSGERDAVARAITGWNQEAASE
jgi:predicted RNA-binding protein YlxR (DUF448 family)